MMRVVHINIAEIIVTEGRRPIDTAKVEQIADFVSLIGMLQPRGLRTRLPRAARPAAKTQGRTL